MRLLALFLGALVCLCCGMIEEIQVPGTLKECFERYSQKTTIVETVGESIASFCFDQFLWKAMRQNGISGFNVSREAVTWAHTLLRRNDIRRLKRQVGRGPLRVRKEYRRMTDEERGRYHRAIQMLKADTSILPNKYDALSAIHQGIMTTAAHGGPNFLGFHRVYVMMFENALREKIGSVTVPYWDSTLDEPLRDPAQSILFTETFLGNGFGVVNNGPFAHWNTLSGPLIRNIGQSGQLFKASDIQYITSRVRMADISEPNAPVNTSLEFLHNQVHLWIDGQMGSLNTAAHDPIFWNHHAYVDYVWELFRRNQRSFGVDPTRDYPLIVNDTMHLPMVSMGLGNFRNIDGLGDNFVGVIYTYEPSPTCSSRFPDCGTPYLRCAMRGFRPTCVSNDWRSAPRPFTMTPNYVDRSNMMAAAAVAQVRQIQQQQVRQRVQQVQQQVQQQVIQRVQQVQQQVQQQQQRVRQQILQRQQMRILNNMQQQAQKTKETESGDDPTEVGPTRQKRWVNYVNTLNGNGQQASPVMVVMNNEPSGQVRLVSNPMHTGTNANNMMAAPGNNTVGSNAPFAANSTSQPPPQTDIEQCPAIPMSHGYQNSFNINGRSDISQWVYIPVKVISQRPPTYGHYESYPVVNGEAEEEDIYSPNRFTNIKQMLNVGTPASYQKCVAQEGVAGKVYVTSRGMNYMGTYKEYAVVDHRLAISISTAYVAVKSPDMGNSDFFLTAYDSCGRVCQAYCKTRKGFQKCNGAFRLSPGTPKMYGLNYGEAITNLWHFSNSGSLPSMEDAGVYVQYHCSFQNNWPFPRDSRSATGGSSTAAEKEVAGEEAEPGEPGEVGTSTLMSNTNGTGCNIGRGCVVSGNCNERCIEGRTYACLGACAMYTSCQNGAHVLHGCPMNTGFSGVDGKCVPGACANRQMQWWITNIAANMLARG